MPDLPIYKYKVKVINEDGISLNTIVRSPRGYKPQDLLAACGNTEITLTQGTPPIAVNALVYYLLNEFFVFSHRTGLYNRQKNFWESLSRVVGVDIQQRHRGLFRKKTLPIYDASFLDYKARPLVYAVLVDPYELPDTAVVTDKALSRLVDSMVRKAQKMTALAGMLLCCPAPFPKSVSDKVAALIAQDPIGRYESLVPVLNVPLDLFEMHQAEPPAEGSPPQEPLIRLIHPDLTTTKRPRAASAP
jgi:hypothetical protein